MKFLHYLIAAFIFIAASNLSAATYCARPSATGNGSGADWNNAVAISTVDGSSSYRGHTIYISGESYGSVTWSAATSGTSTITIKKATASDHVTDTGWNASWGTNQASFASWTFSSNYWVMDGSQKTNSTSGHGFKITTSGKGAIVTGRSYITIKYTEIQGAGDDGDGPGNDLVYASSAAYNITVSDCYLHDSGRTMILSRGGTGWLIEKNYFYRNESVPAEHSEMWSCGTTSDTVVRYNTFDRWEGTGLIVALDSPSGPDNWLIYGNIIKNGASESQNGSITTDSGSSWTNVTIANNTFYANGHNLNFSPDSGGSGWVIRNNIYINNTNSNMGYVGTHTHDYYYNNAFSAAGTNSQTGTNILSNPSAGDFSLTQATNAGYDMSADYTTDPSGTLYGDDGNWDRGAYEFGGDPVDAYPSIEITSPTSSASYESSSDTISLGGTASDDSSVSSVDWACPTCTPSSGEATGTSPTWSVSSIEISEGTNVITVTATDDADQETQDSLTVYYNVEPSDTTPPVVSNILPQGSIDYEDQISISCETDESATCRMDPSKALYDDMEIALSADGNSHSTLYTASPSTAYTFNIRCRDTSGNTTTAQEFSFTTGAGVSDTTPPTVEFTTTSPQETSGVLGIAGTASDAVGVDYCKWNIGVNPDSQLGYSLTGDASWSGDVFGFVAGENTLYVGCSDDADNWGYDSITVIFVTSPSVGGSGSVSFGGAN